MDLFRGTALRNVRAAVLLTLWCLALSATASTYAQTSDIVLYASETYARSGNWVTEPDSTAAGGNRIRNPDSGLPRVGNPLANPSHYFDLTFNAQAGIPYRLWIRAKADANSTNNDSAWVQFSSSVDSSGVPVFRIGTTSATMFNLEECTGCGLSAWGWNDNLFNGFGPLIYFATTGPQTVRIQLREDGLSMDQVVLSPVTWLNFGPGWAKNDSVILAKNAGTVGANDIVLWAADIPTTLIRGSWFRSADASAAGQIALSYPDFGGPRLTTALASPTHYFDVSFNAVAGVSYRLWMRAKAGANSTNNDSVWVQFSSSLNSNGAPDYRIGTTSAIMYNMEECTGCGLSGWGWNDTGINGFGPVVSFATSGTQTLRVQLREDGINIDQIALSPQAYISNSPGAFKNDTVILPRAGGAPASTPTPTPVPNQIPQVSISASTTSGYNPLTVGFNSSATDTDGSIVAYNWNFGDGQTSTQIAPSHVYQSAGSFSARLTVTDNAGATASAAVTINVSNPPSSTNFKVLHWNVAYGRGTDNIIDLNRQATWMANMQVDLISLNEVPPGNIQTYIDLLRQKTGVTWYSHWVPITPGDGVGQQILSRHPIASTGALYLSFSRSVTRVTVNIGGRTVNFFSTHLSYESASWRVTQIAEMKNWMAGFAEQRIVAGDFNLWDGLSEYSSMTSSYYDSWAQAVSAGTAFSYPDNPGGKTRGGRIDFIFYSRTASNLVLKEVRMPDQRDLNNRNVVITVGNSNDWGVRPSDHNFFVTTFELR